MEENKKLEILLEFLSEACLIASIWDKTSRGKPEEEKEQTDRQIPSPDNNSNPYPSLTLARSLQYWNF